MPRRSKVVPFRGIHIEKEFIAPLEDICKQYNIEKVVFDHQIPRGRNAQFMHAKAILDGGQLYLSVNCYGTDAGRKIKLFRAATDITTWNPYEAEAYINAHYGYRRR